MHRSIRFIFAALLLGTHACRPSLTATTPDGQLVYVQGNRVGILDSARNTYRNYRVRNAYKTYRQDGDLRQLLQRVNAEENRAPARTGN